MAYHSTRRVEFRDTDAAGIMHFSAFFTFMEEAEHAMLRSVGLSVVMRDAEGEISWPRVSAQCDYRGAVKFEDVVDIDVRIERMGYKSVTYGFQFSCEGREIATGRLVVVCCRVTTDGLVSIPIPGFMAEKLRTLSETTS